MQVPPYAAVKDPETVPQIQSQQAHPIRATEEVRQSIQPYHSGLI